MCGQNFLVSLTLLLEQSPHSSVWFPRPCVIRPCFFLQARLLLLPPPSALLTPYSGNLIALCALGPWAFTDVFPTAWNNLSPQPSHHLDRLTTPYLSGLSLEVKERLS